MPTFPPPRIRVIAIAIVRRGPEILVFEGFDDVKQTFYYRPLGGGIEPGERAAEALGREFAEELHTAVVNVHQLAVLENLFECNGKAGHEVVFLFECELADRSLYERDVIQAFEHDGSPMRVVWRDVAGFDDTRRLVPEGIEAWIGSARA